MNPLVLPIATAALSERLSALPSLIAQCHDRLADAERALEAHELAAAEVAFQRAGDIARFASYVVQAGRPKGV